ncbi:DUF3306 domain-containing protein [Thalassotalea sp. HSM 43]|uniref:DUF3306 domain-containing protein n=1 Tax=Thalassotalea sp. HSM 43 TaxID=2552945 RepID=UPI0010814560|nr:DUF3306 domain-containing protein [Thalassotalea sp. HSM 43]QBY05268.1 DUF3306 domain-containing protein [Thalassotalea sp. HSM 43]
MTSMRQRWRRWLQKKQHIDQPSENNRQNSNLSDKQNSNPAANAGQASFADSPLDVDTEIDTDIDKDVDSEHKPLAEQPSAQAPLPDPKSIKQGGSFACFMGGDIDPKQQADALKVLWQQPQFQQLDGLEQCDQDFSNQPLLSSNEKQKLLDQIYRYVVEEEPEPSQKQQQELKQEQQQHQALSDAQLGDDSKDQHLANIDTPESQSEATANSAHESKLTNVGKPSDNNEQS